MEFEIYWPVFIIRPMKIQFKKNWCGEVQKVRLQEVWDITYSRWSEIKVESINVDDKFAYLTTYEGDILLSVPTDAYEVIV